MGKRGEEWQESRRPACALSCMGNSGLCMCPQASVSWPYSLSQLENLSQWFSKYDPTPAGSAVPGDLLAIPNFRPYPNWSNQKLGVGPATYISFNKPFSWFQYTGKFENCWSTWGSGSQRSFTLKWILALNSFKLGQIQDSMTETKHSEQLGGRTWQRK